MKHFSTEEAAAILKKLPFSKSWQNTFVAKGKKILNAENGQFEEMDLGDFIFIPAPVLVRHFANIKDFLMFRSDNKSSKAWNYNLVSDQFENNNRRFAIMYAHSIFEPLDIKFLIDDSFTLYIPDSEVQKLCELDSDLGMKEFVRSLYASRTITQKKGVLETWGN